MNEFIYLFIAGILLQVSWKLFRHLNAEAYERLDSGERFMVFMGMCVCSALWPFFISFFLIPWGLGQLAGYLIHRGRVAMAARRDRLRLRAIAAPEKGTYRTSPKPWLLTPEEEEQVMKLRERHESAVGG